MLIFQSQRKAECKKLKIFLIREDTDIPYNKSYRKGALTVGNKRDS